MYCKCITSFLFFTICVAQQTEITFRSGLFPMPPVKFEATYPKGFKVSVPADGYLFFTFCSNVNRELDITNTWNDSKIKNGRLEYRDHATTLKLGDTVYYWILVWKSRSGHSQELGKWKVTEFVNNDEPVEPQPPTPSSSPPTTVTTSCPRSQTVVFGKTTVCQGELIFSEEFDKNSIKDLDNWNPEVQFPQEPDYPFSVYMVDGLRLDNGVLVASASLLESKFHEGFLREQLDLTSTCTAQVGTRKCAQTASGAQILPPVITSKVTTRNKFNFKFGRVEVRAKLPHGNWLLPEISLEPRDAVYGNQRYESGLIRIAFAKSDINFGEKLYGGPVLSDAEPYRSLFMKEKIGSNKWYKDFHNYSLIWKPDGMQLYVDGEEYGNVDPGVGFSYSAQQYGVQHGAAWTRGTAMAPLDEMFYVALGLRVGGINDFADSPEKPWGNRRVKAMLDFWNARESWFPTWYDPSVKVDYVRIYAL